jgi:uncharacterized cofD-like protein
VAEKNENSSLKVVAIGGGAGMHTLLSGLKDRPCDLVAIITVADDGGSSGRLRKDFDIPPPGDIRNCLVAMSEGEPELARLFQYRFEASFLSGHSFGNLFIAALTKLNGDFRGAVEHARKLLNVRGSVLPATESKVTIVAEHPDGSKSTGQVIVAETPKPIVSIKLVPKPPSISDEIKSVLADADLICVGPGRIYTEVMPTLLVPGMVEAINESTAHKLFVANLMTQPGQTEGFTLSDHVESLRKLEKGLCLDMILCAADRVGDQLLKRYAEAGSVPVVPVKGQMNGIRVHLAELIETGPKVRHSPQRLAKAVFDSYDLLLNPSD